MVRLFCSLTLLIFVLVGCNTQPTLTQDYMPTWITNPNQGSKIGAVGSSMQTYDQKTSTQRKLAIARALDELSLQQGVEVDMSLKKEENYLNEDENSKLEVRASYESKSNITAHIEDIYKDNISGELFIWMVLD